MCTAVSYYNASHYFGRNLDLDRCYGEAVTVTPRRYPFEFRKAAPMKSHYAMIGMAAVFQGSPLYYEATNEKGLSLAGLNFPGNAVYFPYDPKQVNIAPFELIPYVLGQCATVEEGLEKLRSVQLLDERFSPELPLTPLHWILADKDRCAVLEPVAEGLKIYDNPVGVLTNNPPFPYHLENLKGYLHLSPQEPQGAPHSLGTGALGLPGDASSPSRFVRAVFTKECSQVPPQDALAQFFHILDAVSMKAGAVRTAQGTEKTVYTSCCNTDTGEFFYTTYENRQLTGVGLFSHDLEGDTIRSYPMRRQGDIRWEVPQ